MPFFKSKKEIDYLIEINNLLKHEKKKLSISISSTSAFKLEIQARAEVINEIIIDFYRSMDDHLLDNTNTSIINDEVVNSAFTNTILYFLQSSKKNLEHQLSSKTTEDYKNLMDGLLSTLILSSQNATLSVSEAFKKQVGHNQILRTNGIISILTNHQIRARICKELLQISTDKLNTPEKLSKEILKLSAIYSKVFELFESDKQNLAILFKGVTHPQYHKLFTSFSKKLENLPQESLNRLSTHDNGRLGFFSKLIRLIEQALGLSTRSEKIFNHVKSQLNHLNNTSTSDSKTSETHFKK